MVLRRATYFVSGPIPPETVQALDLDHTRLDGLNAARHVRVQTVLPASLEALELGTVNVEFSSDRDAALRLPFDAPSKPHLRVVASMDASESAVRELLRFLGVRLPAQAPIEAGGDWYEWHEDAVSFRSSLAPEEGDPIAARIVYSATKKQLTAEFWYAEQPWHVVESKPTELGVFKTQAQSDSIWMHGPVRKLGREEDSQPVMMRWYPKHQLYAKSAPAAVQEPHGLHPELLLHIDGEPPLPQCRLYAQLDLPTSVFLDQYQLDDLPRMSPSAQLIALWGENDLEKPEWSVGGRSTGLLRLFEFDNVTYRLPLHTRYERPNDAQQAHARIPPPYVFWACRNRGTDRKIEHLEPWEFIGLDSVFPLEDTSLFVWPSNAVELAVPVIGESPEKFVEYATTAVVLAGALAVLAAVVFALVGDRKKNKQKED